MNNSDYVIFKVVAALFAVNTVIVCAFVDVSIAVKIIWILPAVLCAFLWIRINALIRTHKGQIEDSDETGVMNKWYVLLAVYFCAAVVSSSVINTCLAENVTKFVKCVVFVHTYLAVCLPFMALRIVSNLKKKDTGNFLK